ncbi:MAG: DUF4349 domain-containing protein [Clostridiaceae bacterium]|jgi:hypothetical protein|nr:DUF4349 domain-containing protein [Clostridiaceae bacterium]
MNKKIYGIILAAILILTTFAACSAAGYKSSTATDRAPTAQSAKSDSASVNFSDEYSLTFDNGESGYAEEPKSEEAIDADSLTGIGGSNVDVSNVILSERKIIRSANLTIEVEDFDAAFNQIESMILGIGFIQETNINTDKVYVEEQEKLVKNGTLVLRVDKAKFDSVLGKLKGVGDVYNYTTNGQDVTDQYVDVEARLRLLKMEQEKLESYLAKLNDLDDIFRTESRLTDIRYQIESLTGSLNKMSSLVDLSTITIQMNEKYPGYKPTKVTYGDRLLDSLKESLLQVVEFLGDFLIIIVAALPVLLIIGIFVLIAIAIIKRIPRKRRERVNEVKPGNGQNANAYTTKYTENFNNDTNKPDDNQTDNRPE